MNRRRLIKSAASAALLPGLALPVFSAASADGTAVRPPVSRVRPGDPAWPSAASWDQLNRDVGGRLIEVRWPLRACHDDSVSMACSDKHMDAVRFAFFAPGNDPEVWRDGWYPAVARMQTAATKASRVEEWWGAGKARLLVVVGLQDVVAPPENGRLIKDEFGDRVTLQEIDGAGHAMLPERPKQVATAVLNFLKPQSK